MRSLFKIVVLGGIAAVIWRIQSALMARSERDDEEEVPSPWGTDLMFGEDVELRESDELDYDDIESLYDSEVTPLDHASA